ncbi:glycosyltransferase family 2 protein [Isoptericola sp. S6320L]|uniref:glycosyltransferase family 2 protein n=1 Tax=Isoptericola sp. S6320L TaxID=2926411 RepID=UPI001FF3D039|nr:glycosyltransferase family 2 protein [Isoptericola sp. S6320L]MCK0115463.1 glycosyltransferase family 2 protein [Isoptericola sp. S6320L]
MNTSSNRPQRHLAQPDHAVGETGPRVVVIIPAHDEQDALPDTIASLRLQTRRPDRVLVVSDNSTDATVAVARAAGAEVMESVANTARKAGALNQAISTVGEDVVMVLDADTTIAPTFIEEGLAVLAAEPRVAAVGGVFRGRPPVGYLQRCQANEYTRYGVQVDVTGRTAVLTGTAALVRRSALDEVAAARGTTLPGRRGDVYDRDAITEDSELTLALRTLGHELRSPVTMSCTTELMPTAGDLHRQRVRWYKGMLDNLAAYGVTRTTARYIGQQVMLVVGTLMMTAFLLLTVVTVVTGTFVLSPLWAGVGLVFAVERLVTVWSAGRRARLLAALVLPELVYDLALQRAFVHAAALFLGRRQTTWNHVTAVA